MAPMVRPLFGASEPFGVNRQLTPKLNLPLVGNPMWYGFSVFCVL